MTTSNIIKCDRGQNMSTESDKSHRTQVSSNSMSDYAGRYVIVNKQTVMQILIKLPK